MKSLPAGHLCLCGCGKPVSGKWNSHTQNYVRYAVGHGSKGKPKSAETRRRMSESMRGNTNAKPGPRPSMWRSDSSIATHHFLRLHYPKAGRCEECGAKGKTDYSFQRYPEPYTRNREDYRELCRACHVAFDVSTGERPDWIFARGNPAGRGA